MRSLLATSHSSVAVKRTSFSCSSVLPLIRSKVPLITSRHKCYAKRRNKPQVNESLPLPIDGEVQPVIHLQPKKLQAWVFNLKKEKIGIVDLRPEIFDQQVRVDIMHEVVVWQRAKARQGTQKAKNRSEVSGGGKKIYKQKGTGRARHGSSRAPQFRKGGVVFAPVPRSYEYSLNKKIRRFGLQSALTAKYREGRLHIINNLNIENHKTRHLLEVLENWNFENVVFVHSADELHPNFALAARSLEWIHLMPSLHTNVLRVLHARNVLITQKALEQLQLRLTPVSVTTAPGDLPNTRINRMPMFAAPTRTPFPVVNTVNNQWNTKLSQLYNNTKLPNISIDS